MTFFPSNIVHLKILGGILGNLSKTWENHSARLRQRRCTLYQSMSHWVVFFSNGKERLPFRMRLVEGKVWIYEVPSLAHDATASWILSIFSLHGFNNMINEINPYKIGQCTLKFDDGSCLEPDLAINNEMRLNCTPQNMIHYPNVVVEVAYSENYASVVNTVPIYFRSAGIRVVIILKLGYSRRVDAEGRLIISYMIASLYRHANWDAGDRLPQQAISFGHRLHYQTVNAFSVAVLSLVDGENVVDIEATFYQRFVGVGRHNNNQPCDHPNNPNYQLTVSAEDVWEGVPEINRPVLHDIQKVYGESSPQFKDRDTTLIHKAVECFKH